MTSVEIPQSVAAALPTLSVFDITNEVQRDVGARPSDQGIAYITAAAPSSLVRVSERAADGRATGQPWPWWPSRSVSAVMR